MRSALRSTGSILAVVGMALGCVAGCASGDDGCREDSMGGSRCTELTITEVEALARIGVPDAARITDSEYTQFQDWMMRAELVLPSGTTVVLDEAVYEGWVVASTGELVDRGLADVMVASGADDGITYRVEVGAGDGMMVVLAQSWSS